jgi:CRP/FNR family transcriptional regulator, cyclic AMP receptor protein
MRKVLYIFGLLNDADVEWMAQTGFRRRLRHGEVVIKEGEATDFLVFLLDGEFLVSTRALGEIARMGVGEVVGEISLVDSAPPLATITTQGDCIALFIDKTTLMQKLNADDGFAARFYHALAVFLADRLRDARGSSLGDMALSDSAIAKDEIDIGILERVSDAGERFNRMLRTLNNSSLN